MSCIKLAIKATVGHVSFETLYKGAAKKWEAVWLGEERCMWRARVDRIKQCKGSEWWVGSEENGNALQKQSIFELGKVN